MTLVMRWCDGSASAQLLADFFARHVTPEYVSHVEIQLGRANHDGTWSGNLISMLAEEFAAVLAPQELQPLHQARAFAGYEDGELICVGIVGFHFTETAPYAVVEDLIVHSEKRGAEYGTRALDWIEASIKQLGVGMLFCETGTSNSVAQSFFRHRGFQAVSVVFLKMLGSAASSATAYDWRSRIWHLGHEQL